MLGTGHALVTRYYNTCFALDDGDAGCFLVDAGGGSGILAQLDRAGVDWRRIRALFVSHAHIDHLLGAVWVLRLVCHHLNEGDYDGGLVVYGNDDVVGKLRGVAELLLRPQETRFFAGDGGGEPDEGAGGAGREAAGSGRAAAAGGRADGGGCVRFVAVSDGEERSVLGRRIAFFDIRSSGARQFGFSLDLDAAGAACAPGGLVAEPSGCRAAGAEGRAGAAPRRLAFCGDEPFNEANRAMVEGAEWLVHEAFCLEADEARYDPHPINHGTVAEACEAAESLGVANLVLCHTEDDTFPHRRERYCAEGSPLFNGRLFVPDDLEAIDLGA